jgi:hypothetical protein
MPFLRTFSLNIFPMSALVTVYETVKLQAGLCLCPCLVYQVFKCLVCIEIRWAFMHCIFCSFFQILYRSDFCGVYLVYIHAEGWICEGLNPEMFDAMHWPHMFSIHLLLKILIKSIWMIKPQSGSVLCCWYDLWSHFVNLWYCMKY